jgi:phage head maturation protease
MNDRETRCYSGEVRAEQRTDEPTRILGYGSVFNSRSEPLWGFREIIKPGAFDDVLNDDVRGLFNHDPNFILGRSAAGTLSCLSMSAACVTTLQRRIRRLSAIWCWHR